MKASEPWQNRLTAPRSADGAVALDHRREHLVDRPRPPVVAKRSPPRTGRRSLAPRPPRGVFVISITPSPIMPRSSSRSRVGTSQSQMWKAWMRARPGARDLREHIRVPPDVIDVDRDAEPARAVRVEPRRRCRAPGRACSRRRGRRHTSDAAARSRARRRRRSHDRAARRSPPRPASRAPAISFDAAEPGRENCGRPPTTSTRHGAPSAAASSTARRLSSSISRAVRGVGREHAAAAIAGEPEAAVANGLDGALEPDRLRPGRARARGRRCRAAPRPR